MGTLKIDAAALAADVAWLAKGKAARAMRHVPVLAAVHVSLVDAGLRLRMTDYDAWREVIVPAENVDADRCTLHLLMPVRRPA